MIFNIYLWILKLFYFLFSNLIIRNLYTQEVNPDGSYSYRYDTSNGISAQESGVGGVSAIGGYHYTSPNGEPVIVTYIADDNGYQPQSDLLPQVPPVPEHVIRLLQWLAKNPSEDDGSYKS